MQLAKLDEYRQAGTSPADVIAHAMASGNQGLYPPPKMKHNNNRGQTFRERDEENAAARVFEMTGGILGRPKTETQLEIIDAAPVPRRLA